MTSESQAGSSSQIIVTVDIKSPDCGEPLPSSSAAESNKRKLCHDENETISDMESAQKIWKIDEDKTSDDEVVHVSDDQEDDNLEVGEFFRIEPENLQELKNYEERLKKLALSSRLEVRLEKLQYRNYLPALDELVEKEDSELEFSKSQDSGEIVVDDYERWKTHAATHKSFVRLKKLKLWEWKPFEDKNRSSKLLNKSSSLNDNPLGNVNRKLIHDDPLGNVNMKLVDCVISCAGQMKTKDNNQESTEQLKGVDTQEATLEKPGDSDDAVPIFTSSELDKFLNSQSLRTDYWLVRKAVTVLAMHGNLSTSEIEKLTFGDVRELPENDFIVRKKFHRGKLGSSWFSIKKPTDPRKPDYSGIIADYIRERKQISYELWGSSLFFLSRPLLRFSSLLKVPVDLDTVAIEIGKVLGKDSTWNFNLSSIGRFYADDLDDDNPPGNFDPRAEINTRDRISHSPPGSVNVSQKVYSSEVKDRTDKRKTLKYKSTEEGNDDEVVILESTDINSTNEIRDPNHQNVTQMQLAQSANSSPGLNTQSKAADSLEIGKSWSCAAVEDTEILQENDPSFSTFIDTELDMFLDSRVLTSIYWLVRKVLVILVMHSKLSYYDLMDITLSDITESSSTEHQVTAKCRTTFLIKKPDDPRRPDYNGIFKTYLAYRKENLGSSNRLFLPMVEVGYFAHIESFPKELANLFLKDSSLNFTWSSIQHCVKVSHLEDITDPEDLQSSEEEITPGTIAVQPSVEIIDLDSTRTSELGGGGSLHFNSPGISCQKNVISKISVKGASSLKTINCTLSSKDKVEKVKIILPPPNKLPSQSKDAFVDTGKSEYQSSGLPETQEVVFDSHERLKTYAAASTSFVRLKSSEHCLPFKLCFNTNQSNIIQEIPITEATHTDECANGDIGKKDDQNGMRRLQSKDGTEKSGKIMLEPMASDSSDESCDDLDFTAASSHLVEHSGDEKVTFSDATQSASRNLIQKSSSNKQNVCKNPSVTTPSVPVFTASEIDKFLISSSSVDFYWLVRKALTILVMHGGFSFDEIFGLKHSDIKEVQEGVYLVMIPKKRKWERCKYFVISEQRDSTKPNYYRIVKTFIEKGKSLARATNYLNNYFGFLDRSQVLHFPKELAKLIGKDQSEKYTWNSIQNVLIDNEQPGNFSHGEGVNNCQSSQDLVQSSFTANAVTSEDKSPKFTCSEIDHFLASQTSDDYRFPLLARKVVAILAMHSTSSFGEILLLRLSNFKRLPSSEYIFTNIQGKSKLIKKRDNSSKPDYNGIIAAYLSYIMEKGSTKNSYIFNVNRSFEKFNSFPKHLARHMLGLEQSENYTWSSFQNVLRDEDIPQTSGHVEGIDNHLKTTKSDQDLIQNIILLEPENHLKFTHSELDKFLSSQNLEDIYWLVRKVLVILVMHGNLTPKTCLDLPFSDINELSDTSHIVKVCSGINCVKYFSIEKPDDPRKPDYNDILKKYVFTRRLWHKKLSNSSFLFHKKLGSWTLRSMYTIPSQIAKSLGKNSGAKYTWSSIKNFIRDDPFSFVSVTDIKSEDGELKVDADSFNAAQASGGEDSVREEEVMIVETDPLNI